jgi:hypothetical protein
VLAALSMLAAGCFGGGDKQTCAEPSEYQESRVIAEINIPPDLDTPDEAQVVRIPPGIDMADAYPEGKPCLEQPPDYFGRPLD